MLDERTSNMEIKEIWKDIPGYEGYFMVSDQGRVKSCDRFVSRGNSKLFFKGQISKQQTKNGGYKIITLNREGKRKTHGVHQLVAMAFLGHKRCMFEFVVNHIDFNTSNNRLSNLEVVTNRQNTSHRKRKGSSKYVGVCWDSHNENWRADIMIDKKQKYIGAFESEIDAHNAYQDKLKEILVNG